MRLKLLAWVTVALIAGAVAGFALRSSIGFRQFRVETCDGDPIHLSHPLGWSPHALDLFVAGYSTAGPVSLELRERSSTHPSDSVVLAPRNTSKAVGFARVGDWYSEAELRLIGEGCQLVVFYRFRALP